MTLLNAIVQGIIQGLTEFLPISSSGHLAIFQYFTGQNGESSLLFSLLLHLGTLLAVFIAFWSVISEMILELFRAIGDIFKGKFSFKNPPPARRMIFLLFVSLLPMIISVPLLDLFDKIASDGDIIVEGICFLITSALLFLSDRCVKGQDDASTTKYRSAAAIGTMQALAPFPGISRSGSTVAVGLIAGLSREFAVSFSFIMGIPTILGANILKISDALNAGVTIPPLLIIVGVLTALVVGLLSIKLVKWLINTNKFTYFAWYTLILGVLIIALGIYELYSGGALRQSIIALN